MNKINFLRIFPLKINLNIVLTIPDSRRSISNYLEKNLIFLICLSVSVLSVLYFYDFYKSGLNLAYNDARSHLDIARRVVEGLKPGLAQLGSVWLPLPHFLMIPTVWNDFMWHSGLSGAILSMASFVFTAVLIYLFLKQLNIGLVGRIIGVLIFALNLNVLYLQSTAMTELLLIATGTAASYYLTLWVKSQKIIDFIKCAFFVFLATLTRYDGWFLFLLCIGVISLYAFLEKKGQKINVKQSIQKSEGLVIFFCTLAGFGIVIWLIWNLLIFNDVFYFIFGPYSAKAQQAQLEAAGNLITQGNLLNSIKTYTYALFYNVGTFTTLLSVLGLSIMMFDKKLKLIIKLATLTLLAPLFFNIIALFFGHSVLFIQGINGDVWFNVRYGIMLIPAVAVFVGFLVDRLALLRWTIIGLLVFTLFFSFSSYDAVTIDDARVGSSQKNVSEVSSWLKQNAQDKPGFILISAASHDAIIFSSGMPMKRFIHEGTGAYWEKATQNPDLWARWIVLRTNDDSDQTFKLIKDKQGFSYYNLVGKYPFADIYELKEEFLGNLTTTPILGKQK